MNGCFSSLGGTPINFVLSIFKLDKPIPPLSSAATIPSLSHSVADDCTISIGSSSREAIGLSLSLGLFPFPWLFHAPGCYAAEVPHLELTMSPSGLAYTDKVVGSGPEAVKGQLIKVHYVGQLENGKVFDSSYNRGKPLTFRIGVGEVIKGWDEGILGGDGVTPMLAGGKRILKIPPELGYGMRGAGCRGGSCIIPPGSVLLFDLEFIGKA